jgi:Superinfection immunity protein
LQRQVDALRVELARSWQLVLEPLGVVGIGFYLLPTLIAGARDKTYSAAGLFLLNIFLGWTLIRWLVAYRVSFRMIETKASARACAAQ